MFLHARDLQVNKNRQQKRRHYLFQIQLERCLLQVKRAHETLKDYIFYRVPSSIPGEPTYDFTAYMEFLKQKLKERGFYRKILIPGDILYISWNDQLIGNKVEETTQDIVIEYDPNNPRLAQQIQEQLTRLTGNLGSP